MRYLCDKCEYAATSAGSLKCHIESKHEGVRYPCDKCEYAATSASHLKRYIESKQEWVRYPCGKSEYAATEAGNLKRHLKSKQTVRVNIHATSLTTLAGLHLATWVIRIKTPVK